MTLRPEKRRKGSDMLGTPDEHVDAAKFHAEDLQRAMQRDQVANTRMLTRYAASCGAFWGARTRPHHHR